jgi:hypothetical protein
MAVLPICYNQWMLHHRLAQKNKASQTESRLDLLEKIIGELVRAINKPFSSIERINQKRRLDTKLEAAFEEPEVLTLNRDLTWFVIVLLIYWILLFIPGYGGKSK